MLFNDFCESSVARLGMGTMRLPCTDGVIAEVQVREMVKYAMERGINYFDTAYPYHGGMSERVMGRVLGEYPRESYCLATKYPGHQIQETYDPAAIFEEQLEKCGVDYFDFYLLHNVNEKSIGVYMDEEIGILRYFLEQKKQGRIRHLGFSSHGSVENLREFLDYCGDEMEFCQIQLNYLDWTLQDAKEKYEMLCERNIPIIVMEPIRGGMLAKLPDEADAKLKKLRPDEAAPAWALRFLCRLPGVKVILSGMSNMEQLKDNIATFDNDAPLSDYEVDALFEAAEALKTDVPCTECRYCCDGCPAGLDIPLLLKNYVEAVYSPSLMFGIRMEALEADGNHPKNCIGCGACAHACPQNIEIPHIMADFAEKVAKIPRWDDICRQRAEEAKKNRK